MKKDNTKTLEQALQRITYYIISNSLNQHKALGLLSDHESAMQNTLSDALVKKLNEEGMKTILLTDSAGNEYTQKFLLTSNTSKLQAFMDGLKEQYDLVLMNLNNVESQPIYLFYAAMANENLLMVSPAKDSRKQVHALLDTLNASSVPVGGMLFDEEKGK